MINTNNSDLTQVKTSESRELAVRYVLNHLATTSKSGKYFFVKDRSKNISQDEILQIMVNMMPQVPKEILSMAVTNYQNVISGLLMEGKSVSTLLFHATPTLRGTSEDGTWNPEENQIEVSFRQGKRIREMVKTTSVVVNGMREGCYLIAKVTDNTTGATDGTATAGRCITLQGTNIKVEGDAPEVGITLTNEETGEIVSLSVEEDLVVNTATKVAVQLPSDLPEAQYKLTITAQNRVVKGEYTKTVHEASTSIYVSPRA